MLLDENKKLRDAAAAHLRHIANEPGDGTWRPRDFALASYLELLEEPFQMRKNFAVFEITKKKTNLER